MQREAVEELGVMLKLRKILFDYTPEQTDTSVSWRTIVFAATVQEGMPRIMEPDVCTDMRWVTRAELKTLPLTTYATEDFKRLGWL